MNRDAPAIPRDMSIVPISVLIRDLFSEKGNFQVLSHNRADQNPKAISPEVVCKAQSFMVCLKKLENKTVLMCVSFSAGTLVLCILAYKEA